MLAIETSGRVGSVALAEDGRVVAGDQFPHGLRHAAEMIPRIDRLCASLGIGPRDLGEIAVSIGPGSFTGLRIGVTLAKTLAMVTGARLIAVPTVRAVARNAPDPATELIVVLDAKRERIFTAALSRNGSDWIEREPAHLDDLGSMLSRAPRPVWLLGDGIPAHRQFLPPTDMLVHLTSPELWQPRASAVVAEARILAAAGDFIEPDRLVPVYLRKAEAEEVWERKHPGEASSEQERLT